MRTFAIVNHAELRQNFYHTLTGIYPQGELQALYHWCINEIEGWSRAEAYFRSYDPVELAQLEKWHSVMERLQRYEPVQYVFNKAVFCGLDLYVDQRVLIPRPETEELVELVLKHEHGSRITVADLGTGSGCIALALKSQRPDWTIFGSDLSKPALQVAQINAENLGLQVEFKLCDISNCEDILSGIDCVVSNPPYIPNELSQSLEKNVLNHEPHLALFAPKEDPYYFFVTITHAAQKKGVKRVYFETHATDINMLIETIQKVWNGTITVHNDGALKPRFVQLMR